LHDFSPEQINKHFVVFVFKERRENHHNNAPTNLQNQEKLELVNLFDLNGMISKSIQKANLAVFLPLFSTVLDKVQAYLVERA